MCYGMDEPEDTALSERRQSRRTNDLTGTGVPGVVERMETTEEGATRAEGGKLLFNRYRISVFENKKSSVDG